MPRGMNHHGPLRLLPDSRRVWQSAPPSIVGLIALATCMALLARDAAGEDDQAVSRRRAHGPLRVHPTNPRYFTDGTKTPDGSWKAVYLTGSHTWANLIDRGTSDPPPAFDFDGYLDFLQKHHHNFIRLWSRHVSWYQKYGERPLHAGAAAVAAHRPRQGARRQAEVRPDEVRRRPTSTGCARGSRRPATAASTSRSCCSAGYAGGRPELDGQPLPPGQQRQRHRRRPQQGRQRLGDPDPRRHPQGGRRGPEGLRPQGDRHGERPRQRAVRDRQRGRRRPPRTGNTT